MFEPTTSDYVALTEPVAAMFAEELLVGAGTPRRTGGIVAKHLTANSRREVNSHGLRRLPQYVQLIEQRDVDPTAVPRVKSNVAAQTFIDGCRSFGQLGGSLAVDHAANSAADYGIGYSVLYNTGHVGRAGAYTEAGAERGFMAMAFCSGVRRIHRVAPFNSREPRLATNPITFAFPTEEAPVVADFATSARAEGYVRSMLDQGLTVPRGVLVDADGQPAQDPSVLYADPPGALLPIGNDQGYKGFALGILAEAMATLLAGQDSTDEQRYGNNMTVILIKLPPGFPTLASALSAYIRSAKPVIPGSEVQMPGDPEAAAFNIGPVVRIDQHTWEKMQELAGRYGVTVPDPGAESQPADGD